MARLNMPRHRWTAERWQAMYQHRRLSGPLLAAFAFHLSDVPLPLQDTRCRQPLCYARAVFGRDICQQEWQRLLAVLVSPGYSRRTQEMFLSAVLSLLMLENGDPRRESFTEALLTRGQQHRTEGIARAVGKVSHGLAAMGILHRPLRMRGYIGWREKNTDGIAPEWATRVPALAGNVRAAPQDPRVLLQYHPAYRFVAGPGTPADPRAQRLDHQHLRRFYRRAGSAQRG